jgi:RNA polymerase sigma factor (sigma-70 family)
MPTARLKKSTATRQPKSSPPPPSFARPEAEPEDTKPYLRDCGNSSRQLDALLDAHAPLTRAQEQTATPEELFYHNLRFARKQASAWAPSVSEPFFEVEAAALRGLWKAALKYDREKIEGGRFINFAKWQVVHEITRLLDENFSGIRIPRKARHNMARIAAGLPVTGTTARHLADLRAIHVDAPASTDSLSDTLGDMVGDPSPSPDVSLLKAETNAVLNRWMACLTITEKQVLTLRYGLADGEPLGLRVIAKILGVTYQRIEQLEKQALRKLRAHNHLKKIW